MKVLKTPIRQLYIFRVKLNRKQKNNTDILNCHYSIGNCDVLHTFIIVGHYRSFMMIMITEEYKVYNC